MSEAVPPQPRPATDSRACIPHPFVSVIVCTLGNRPRFWECLRSLLSQACHKSEIVVVLNGPPQEDFARALSAYPVRLLNEPRRGVSVARNCALPQARGEILAFADDDVIASPNWLHELVKGFEDPQVACVTGLVAPEGTFPHSKEKAKRYFASDRAQSTWTLSNTEPDWLQKAISEPAGFGCNMAFRKDFLERYGPFPVDLGAGSLIGSGDEFCMFVQVLKHGFRIYHAPSAVVTHDFGSPPDLLKPRILQLYTGTIAFAVKLYVEEKGLRRDSARWLLHALRRRLRRVFKHRTVSSEPQELLTTPEKLHAYLRGPLVYWRSRRAMRAQASGSPPASARRR